VATYQTLLAVLADPTRRTLLERLAQKAQSVGELASKASVSRPAVSQHLKALGDAGLVSFERVGTRNVYQVTPEGLQPLQHYLETLRGSALLTRIRPTLATRPKAKR
jgi:DNA-binding transcriptional ArsR family regulator